MGAVTVLRLALVVGVIALSVAIVRGVLALAWKPPAKGAYSLAFGAVDRGGNHQNAVKVTALRVK